MTIPNENRKISYDIDNTSLFTYAYTFSVIDPATVIPSFFDVDGAEVVVVMTRTVSSSPSANEYFVDEDNNQILIGGSGTLQTEYGSSIVQLLIVRDVDFTQDETFPTATNLQTDSIETGLDKNMTALQQVNETVSRALVIPIQDDSSRVTELPAAAERADKFLSFDSNGDPTVDDEPTVAAEASAAAAAVSAAAALVSETNAGVSAAESAASAVEAEDAVASVNLPIIAGGDAGKILVVSVAEDGYELDDLDDTAKLPLAGGTMSGVIQMGTNKIRGVGDPFSAQDVATMNFVVDQKQETLGSSTTVDSEANAFIYAHAYSAPTDGYVTAWDETGGTVKVDGFVGGSDDPAGAGTNVAANRVTAAGQWTFISFFVPKGQFWEVTTTGGSDGAATIRWQALGALINPVDQD